MSAPQQRRRIVACAPAGTQNECPPRLHSIARRPDLPARIDQKRVPDGVNMESRVREPRDQTTSNHYSRDGGPLVRCSKMAGRPRPACADQRQDGRRRTGKCGWVPLVRHGDASAPFGGPEIRDNRRMADRRAAVPVCGMVFRPGGGPCHPESHPGRGGSCFRPCDLS